MSATRITPKVLFAIDVDYDEHEGIWTFFPMHGELERCDTCWIQSDHTVNVEEWA